MNGILWLASYPKSGNTWVRVFLSNLLRDADEPADINRLERTPIAGARKLFDDYLGVTASDLTADEIDVLRPRLYEQIAREARRTPILKIHDARLQVRGRELIPASATRGAIYIVRDPRDVAVSFAAHMGAEPARAIAAMAREDFALAAGFSRLPWQLRQRLSSWSGHATSWLEQRDFPVHVVRYEDLKRDPFETFGRLARFGGFADAPDKIEKAIAFSSFEVLRGQEDENGFDEKPTQADKFFRRGEAGGWRTSLTAEQSARIARDHAEVMARFGYAPDARAHAERVAAGPSLAERPA